MSPSLWYEASQTCDGWGTFSFSKLPGHFIDMAWLMTRQAIEREREREREKRDGEMSTRKGILGELSRTHKMASMLPVSPCVVAGWGSIDPSGSYTHTQFRGFWMWAISEYEKTKHSTNSRHLKTTPVFLISPRNNSGNPVGLLNQFASRTQAWKEFMQHKNHIPTCQAHGRAPAWVHVFHCPRVSLCLIPSTCLVRCLCQVSLFVSPVCSLVLVCIYGSFLG